MTSIYSITFCNKKFIQFDAGEFSILNNSFFLKLALEKIFSVIAGETILDFMKVLRHQLDFFLNDYTPAGPIFNPRFEDRWEIIYNGNNLVLNIKTDNHFKIYQCIDILNALELTLLDCQKIYIVTHKHFTNKLELPVICRVKHFVSQNSNNIFELERYIIHEFPSINLEMLHLIISKLNDFGVIQLNKMEIKRGLNFDFFN